MTNCNIGAALHEAAEKRRQYRMLIENVANTAALKQEFQRELNKIEKSLAAEGKTP